DRATHEYLQNQGGTFWGRFVGHHRPYLGLYWQRLLEGGPSAFKPREELRWGWIAGQNSWSAVEPGARRTMANRRVDRQVPAADFRNNTFARSFRRTLAFLRERGADVCVVTTPISYEYLEYSRRN